MKKAIIFSFLALSCMLMSCTADAIPQAATTTVKSAEDIGGQSGQIPVPPPPTKP